ncbi:hypothetical protein CRG98_033935 [Punica granatum]|uniref:Reverse transcriptase domain-containing protein n=1 Tax=Punica granatum TaxID=22663 RepID=A0A2I0INP5_PUNGR|nr:hypothetical protein CRG98_033935 [Punica granatum]
MAGDPTVRALRLLQNKYQPNMIFISETKIESERCKNLALRCKPNGIVSVDALNSAGDLCLLWNTELKRLDRAIAHDEWRLLFLKVGVKHLPSLKSDHNPILVKLWMKSANHPKPFRFEEVWTRDPSSYENFKDLFTSTGPNFPDDLEGLVEPIITFEKNTRLISLPSSEEITHALNSIPNLKAPGPDGIPSLVYKHYGSIIKPLLISAVQNFFSSGKILKEWNTTFITLVPKLKKASTFKDFRPISLCNVCYKVI